MDRAAAGDGNTMNLIAWRPTPRLLIGVGLGALVVLVVLGGLWFWYSAQQERAQSVHADALARAAAVRSDQPAETRAAAIQALETALAQAPGAPLAGQTAYELGNLRFDAGQFPAARAAYEIALVKASSATVRTLSRAGIAATWEAQGDFRRAIDAYTTALSGATPSQFYFEELLLGLGRTQELAGQRAQAAETYRRLLKEVPKPRHEPEIRGRLASLGSSS